MVLGVEPEIIADWGRRLAAEPTIANERAVAQMAGNLRGLQR